jgi:murein DD-endopeptidase MepM/ murein hydrolase activator NlpD
MRQFELGLFIKRILPFCSLLALMTRLALGADDASNTNNAYYEQRLNQFAEAVEGDDFKTIFDFSRGCQLHIENIHTSNPQVLWQKLDDEYYESSRQRFVQRNTPAANDGSYAQFSSALFNPGSGGVDLPRGFNDLYILLHPKPTVKYLETREGNLDQIGGEIGLHVMKVYASLDFSAVQDAPKFHAGEFNSGELKRLKSTIIMVYFDDTGFVVQAQRVEKGDVFQDDVEPTRQATTPSEISSASSATDEQPNPTGSLLGVCPNGKIGGFGFGTKCTGFYNWDEAKQKDVLVDIQIAGTTTSLNYTKTKSLVHGGVDIVAPEGSELFPIADGTVDDVLLSPADPNFNSLGYMVTVEHKEQVAGKPTFSLYLHMKEKPKVEIGQDVVAGKTLLGYVGSTGAAFGAHVHIEVRHFAGRFSPKWNNIYGIERPKEEATFDETDFEQNWINPADYAPPKPKTLLQLTKDVEFANEFDLHTKNFAYPLEQVQAAIAQVIKDQKDTLAQYSERTDKTQVLFVTDLANHSLIFGTSKQYFILVDKIDDNSCVVNLKLLELVPDLDKAQGTNIPNRPVSNKDVTNDTANKFLDKVLKKLTAAKT